MTSRILVPATMFAALSLLLVFPVLRARFRYGTNAYVLLAFPGPVQRIADGWMLTIESGWLIWTIVYWAADPRTLGIVTLPGWLEAAAWSATVLGILLSAVAQAQMGTSFRIGIDPNRTPLVTHGLYTYVRNPIFGFICLAIAGLSLLTLSAWSVMGLAMTVFVFQLQSRLEEQHLTAIHGQAYRQYAAATGRFLPGLGRIR